MQIFVVEDRPQKAAKALCDKHVLSQIGETAEMLALAHMRNEEPLPPLARLKVRRRHLNHPCTKWVGLTLGNFQWAADLGVALLDEYSHRYGKEHAYTLDIYRMACSPPFKLLSSGLPETPHPLVVPENYRMAMPATFGASVILSYRIYYHVKSAYMPMRWTRRRKPKWFDYAGASALHLDVNAHT